MQEEDVRLVCSDDQREEDDDLYRVKLLMKKQAEQLHSDSRYQQHAGSCRNTESE